MSFKKHLKEDFTITVCNSESMARDPRKCKEVNEVCRSLGIEVVNAERDRDIEEYRNCNFTYGSPEPFFTDGRFHTPGNAGNYLMQWSWEKIASKADGLICYCHSDVFLIEPIKFSDYLKDYQIASVMPGKSANDRHPEIKYLWEPLLLADIPKLLNPETMVWWPSRVEDEWLDTGGRTYYYLKAHPEVKVLELGQSSGINGDVLDDDDLNSDADFHPTRYRFIHFPDKRVFHYLSGTRWCTDSEHGWNWGKDKADEYHRRKLNWTKKLIGL
jgi:hypothetical protein